MPELQELWNRAWQLSILEGETSKLILGETLLTLILGQFEYLTMLSR